MLTKAIAEIAKADIDSLVTAEAAESLTLEYKEQLPGGTDDERKEFLADVSALANSAGGDILYGIRERRGSDGKGTGQPEVALGVSVVNADAEQLRLTSLLQTGVAPRLPVVQMRWIDGFSQGPVLVLRVRRSWVAPHMLCFKGGSRFYGRSGSSKYQLDVHQLRSAFLGNEGVAERVRQFRTDRVAKVIADQTPVRLNLQSRLIVDVIPLSSVDTTNRVDISQQVPDSANALRMNGNSQWLQRFNLDGYLSFGVVGSEAGPSYVQVFRHGAVEGVTTRLTPTSEGRRAIFAHDVEMAVVDLVQTCLGLYEQWSISGPISVGVSLVNVPGAIITSDSRVMDNSAPVDREHLLLPDALIDDTRSSVPEALRPAFDALWQSAGKRGSPNYDRDGNWARPVQR